MISQRYREVEILTASPEALVAKLYAGAIRFCREAAEHGEAGRKDDRGRAIARALAIVGELHHALDHDQGGPIAENLEVLYGFVADRLLEASVSDGPRALHDAERVLSELQGAWDDVASRTPAGEGRP